MAKTTTTKGSKTTKNATKGSKTKTAQKPTPALDPATMPDDELNISVSVLFNELKKRAKTAEDGKQERIAALRAELLDLGAPIVTLPDLLPDEKKYSKGLETDPRPNLKDLMGIRLQSQDKHFLGSALVVAAYMVEWGIIIDEHPNYEVDIAGTMYQAAIMISRAMYAATKSQGEAMDIMRDLTAPDVAKAAEDD